MRGEWNETVRTCSDPFDTKKFSNFSPEILVEWIAPLDLPWNKCGVIKVIGVVIILYVLSFGPFTETCHGVTSMRADGESFLQASNEWVNLYNVYFISTSIELPPRGKVASWLLLGGSQNISKLTLWVGGYWLALYPPGGVMNSISLFLRGSLYPVKPSKRSVALCSYFKFPHTQCTARPNISANGL